VHPFYVARMLHVTQCIAFPVRSNPGRPQVFKEQSTIIREYTRNFCKSKTGSSLFLFVFPFFTWQGCSTLRNVLRFLPVESRSLPKFSKSEVKVYTRTAALSLSSCNKKRARLLQPCPLIVQIYLGPVCNNCK
jgi:hypothetical protein